MFKLKNCEFIGLPGISNLKFDISRITTFTGPNGTGKSTVLKVIDLALRILEEREVCNKLPQHDPWHLFHSATLKFESEEIIKTDFLGDVKILTIQITSYESNYYISSIASHERKLSIARPTPRFEIQNWEGLVAKAKLQLVQLEQELQSTPGHAQNQIQHQQNPARTAAIESEKINSQLIEENINLFVESEIDDMETSYEPDRSSFIDFLNEINLPTVRHITTQQLIEQNIQILIDRLILLKKGNKKSSKEFYIIEERLNKILQAEIDISETGDGKKTLLIHGIPHEKASTGTYLTLSFFSLTESEDPNKIVLWDEPENGLHPTRRIQLLELMRLDERQFIIATHATEFTPVLQKDSEVYRCVNNYDEEVSKFKFSVASVANRRDAFLTLEALGIHPARTLFTANVVIWIEGPTELIFYRHWLTRRLERDGFQEGLHYSFMQYGGSLINYLEVADDKQFISTIDLLSHCRNPIVLVDSDIEKKPLNESEEVLKPGARRIEDEIKKLNISREGAAIFQATQGREIENYLPKSAVLHAIETLWKEYSSIKNGLSLDKIDLGRYRKYPEAIAEFFTNENIIDAEKLPKGRSIWGATNKVGMMRAALSMPDFDEPQLQHNCSRELDEIEKFIRAKHNVEYSNGLKKV